MSKSLVELDIPPEIFYSDMEYWVGGEWFSRGLTIVSTPAVDARSFARLVEYLESLRPIEVRGKALHPFVYISPDAIIAGFVDEKEECGPGVVIAREGVHPAIVVSGPTTWPRYEAGTVDEIAEELGWSVDDVRKVVEASREVAETVAKLFREAREKAKTSDTVFAMASYTDWNYDMPWWKKFTNTVAKLVGVGEEVYRAEGKHPVIAYRVGNDVVVVVEQPWRGEGRKVAEFPEIIDYAAVLGNYEKARDIYNKIIKCMLKEYGWGEERVRELIEAIEHAKPKELVM